MNEEALIRRRDRTRAVVEGALLADIAIVFLLMRAFLPVPGLRQLLRGVASVPFVMLTQRRGFRLAVLAGISSFLLFSALVGPLLALAAVDIAIAGILVGLGRRVGLSPTLNLIWTTIVYTFLDLLVPTVASVYLFRYPIKKLAQAARNFVNLVFNVVTGIANRLHMSSGAVHSIKDAEHWASAHWLVPWVGTLLVYGLLTMYLAIIIAEMVLKQVPAETLAPRRAA